MVDVIEKEPAMTAQLLCSDKSATTLYELHPLIAQRWSPRAFDDSRELEMTQVCQLLEAARWAPSCFNEQPWRFFVGHKTQTPDAWNVLFDLLVPFNQGWAKRASMITLSVAKETFTQNGKPNRHAQHDVGLAMENMVIQAASMGIASHQMAGFDDEKARQVLAIPPDYTPMAMCVFGYPASADTLDKELKEREEEPRSRKALYDITFSTHWDHTYPLCEG